MTERWMVVGADPRMKLIAKLLSDGERTVFYKHCGVWDSAVQSAYDSFQPMHLVLPILPIENVVERSLKNVVVFAGKLDATWEALMAEVKLHRYLEYEPFIWKNAHYTALGIAAYLLGEGEVFVGRRFIVTGFGRVAKMTARILASLQAEVVIAVRSLVQRAEAEAYGYKVLHIEKELPQDADYIVNTIPARWLSCAKVDAVPRRKVLDVASKPGCLLEDIEPDNYVFLHALPAKYFPDEAARILVEAIEELSGGGSTC